MSFILDALKKSEIERQRQSAPGLVETRTPRSARLPLWALLLGVLLAVNIAVLLLVLMRGGTAPPKPPVADSVPAEKPAPLADHFSPLDSAPVYAPEIPVPPSEGNARTSAAPPAALPVAPRAAPRRPDPLLSDQKADEDGGEVLPSISEINLTGAQALPELHLDVHVYATRPADRFVYINMRKYHEGSVLQEGPVIERIRRDGVVLKFQGLRFVLPRQS